jgi:localization factor PodJL
VPASDEPLSYANELAGVQQRLDGLAKRLDQFTGSGAAAYAPRRQREAEELGAAPPAPPPLPPTLDRALAEIAARQRVLDAEPIAPMPDFAVAAAATPALPTPANVAPDAAREPQPIDNLTGLEAQLRKITDQIETLRKPGVEQAIGALREELAEIGRVLDDAMPRWALEPIEQQMRDLSQRIAEVRQAGIDPRALAGIEERLEAARETLHGLTPAESLVGYSEAIADLAQKIDLIVAEKDPATMHQLESAVHTLRGMVDHVASNEVVGRLSDEVQMLADKVERLNRLGTLADVLWSLEQRIDALGEALQERADQGNAVSPELEALVASLADKIDRIQHARSEDVAVSHLEDRIVQLMERLDASDSRLGHLEAIERGLADLLVHIEAMRSWREQGAVGDPAAVESLRDDVARTQDSLDTMQSTLGLVVDRLTTIEGEIRAERYTPVAAEEAALELIRAVTPAGATPALKPMPAVAPLVADREPPADQPLEPGSGPPLRAQPAVRIAASEPASDGAAPATPAAARSSFIAAARRAAQAAAQAPDISRGMPFVPGKTSASRPGKAMKRAKSALIAASIVALVVGSIQIGGSLLGLDSASKLARKTTQLIGQNKTAANPQPASTNDRPAAPPAAAPPITLAEKTIEPSRDAGLGLSSPPAVGNDLIKLPPAAVAPPDADITGSIPQAKPATEQLPVTIGGLWLRQAAIAGDAAAAYEVGTRYAEGRGVPVNLEEAARWFERAASKDLAPAQFRYASQLEKGLGVKKDLSAARKLYLAAAAKGNAKAMHNLAVLYAEGVDGKPDFKTALKWFQKAADYGVADSQYNLGILYARGIGVDANLSESYKWFALAATQGDAEAGKKRDEVAGRLDAPTLAAARRAVDTFKAVPQPAAAVTVPAPAGGWDKAAAAATAGPRVAATFTMAK